MEDDLANTILWGGIGFGVVFGALLQRFGFCMLAAVTNYSLMRDFRHLHAWLAALVIAIPGSALLEASGMVDIAASSFRSAPVQWFGPIMGGLAFGIGTTLAGGCASRTLIRTGEGNIGALVTLVSLTVAAITTLFGVLAPVRAWIQQLTAVDAAITDNSLFGLTGLPPVLLAVIISLGLLATILITARNNHDWRMLGMGAGLGALVVAAWLFTGYLTQDEFDAHPPYTLGISGPLASSGLWLMTAKMGENLYGVGLIGGALLGSAASAVLGRNFHWILPEASRLPYLIIGGLMMGSGAVLAGGCNIGQGLGGLSTCSLTSLLAVLAIFSGMRIGLIWIDHIETTFVSNGPAH